MVCYVCCASLVFAACSVVVVVPRGLYIVFGSGCTLMICWYVAVVSVASCCCLRL